MTIACQTDHHAAASEVKKELNRVQSSDEEKKAYKDYILYGEVMKDLDGWVPMWPPWPFEVMDQHADWKEHEDLNEMFDDMDVFEKDMNLQLQLRVPHEFRRHSCAPRDEMSSSDTMTTEVRVSKKGDNYWTGDSDFGKVFIPMDLVHHIQNDAVVKMRVKVMGPHVQIPLRSFFTHRNKK